MLAELPGLELAPPARQVRTCSDRRNARVRLKPSQEKKGQVVGRVREGWSSRRA